LGQMLILGLTFGVCFLVRNDAVFLIAAILSARFVLLWPRDLRALRWRIVEGAVPGVVSLLIALPWLFYNYRLFGSIVPISGVAGSTHARFGQNLALVPTTIVELVTVIAPIPRAFESSTLIIWLSVLLTGVAALLSIKLLWARSASGRFVLIAYLIFSILVIGFYGLFFGAGHFIPRFLGVLSPFFALLGVSAGYRLLLAMRDHHRRTITLKAGAALAMVAVLGANWIIYRNGHYHQHMQVVDWVEAHVPNQTWVAAVQSGTLGFFHDRTINLDGKVNAEALRAAARDGGVTSYLLRSEATYLADWYGMASWAKIDKEGFNSHFELIVADERANLAVLRRVYSR
jgi:hypothetical protein